MGVSKNNGTPKSSILIGFSIIFTIHFGVFYPYFWKHPHITHHIRWIQAGFAGCGPLLVSTEYPLESNDPNDI